jgi:hypothetical protein
MDINRISKKPVFCTETFQMIYDHKKIKYRVTGITFTLVKKTLSNHFPNSYKWVKQGYRAMKNKL